jgi:hypothetical protein
MVQGKATLVGRQQEEIDALVARYKSKEQKHKDENRSLCLTVAEQKRDILSPPSKSETIRAKRSSAAPSSPRESFSIPAAGASRERSFYGHYWRNKRCKTQRR